MHYWGKAFSQKSRGMNEVYGLLADRLPWRVLRQGDLPRQKLLDAFREDLHAVLFATASFWEGVDVQGGGPGLRDSGQAALCGAG
jgi:Rad3-related DNA helicase